MAAVVDYMPHPKAISLVYSPGTGQIGYLGTCESGFVGEHENDRVDT